MHYKAYENFGINLKDQINVSILKLNEREKSRPISTSLKTSPNREQYSPKQFSDKRKQNGFFNGDDAIQIPDLDNLNEMQRENIRRFILSPFPLVSVPKPRKILFGNENSTGSNTVSMKLESPTKHQKQVNYVKLPESCQKKSSEKTKTNDNKKSFATKDNNRQDLPNSTRSSKLLNQSKLDVSVGVNKTYYQKWARNKKSSYKSIFPSLKTKEIRRTSKSSKRKYKYQSNAKKEAKAIISESSICDFSNSKPLNVLEEQGLDSYYDNSDNIFEDLEDTEERHNDIVDSTDSELERVISEDVVDSTDIFCDNDEIRLSLVPETVAPLKNFQNVLSESISSSRGNKCRNCQNGKLGPSTRFYTLLDKQECFGILSEVKCAKEPCPCEVEQNRKLSPNDVSLILNDGNNRHISRKYVSLSTKEISTSVLDNVSDLLPLKDSIYHEKRNRPINVAYRRTVGKPKLYTNKNNSKIMKSVHSQLQDVTEKQTKEKHALGSIDSVPNFRCKRLIRKFSVDVSNIPSSRNRVNRIPFKMAETSPRYTGPENLVVDFEALRIAAHLQRLKTNIQSGKAESAQKMLQDAKSSDEMSCIDKNGLKTVVSGCIVR